MVRTAPVMTTSRPWATNSVTRVRCPEQQYRRRVGTVRPSHLMFTGAVVDLPNFAAMVGGIDDSRYEQIPDWSPIAEPRLRAAVRATLGGPQVKELRPAPWLAAADNDPIDPSLRIGVPVMPFTQWLRCTRCDTLAGSDSGIFGSRTPRRADPTRPGSCTSTADAATRSRSPPVFSSPASTGTSTSSPYVSLVHKGVACERQPPTVKMRTSPGTSARTSASSAPTAALCGTCARPSVGAARRTCRGGGPGTRTGNFPAGLLRRRHQAAGGRRLQLVVRADTVRVIRAPDRGHRARRDCRPALVVAGTGHQSGGPHLRAPAAEPVAARQMERRRDLGDPGPPPRRHTRRPDATGPAHAQMGGVHPPPCPRPRAYPLVIAVLGQALARDARFDRRGNVGGAGSAIRGPEPAAAFAGPAAVELWHWPKKFRSTSNAKMHAKIAIADRRELLVSS